MECNSGNEVVVDESLKEFCERLPKIELHAHLNGSLSKNTLTELCKLQKLDNTILQEISDIDKFTNLEDVFNVFNIAHSVTTTIEAVYIATCNVIKEFAQENVIYMELRSTPRSIINSMTKREYVESILRAIRDCQVNIPNITVKLLISVNRKQSIRSAKENIELAITMKEEYSDLIVGIDLSGDPTKGGAFINLLTKSREAGLKIAAHCGEVPNESEAMDIILFKPDRLGHCTCIHPSLQGSENLYQVLLNSKIPVELCLTSNVKCKTVPNYEDHHFKYLFEAKHPICICTDDKGVFNSNLTNELQMACKYFKLRKEDLKEIMMASVNYAFANEEEKRKIQNVIHLCE